MSILSTSSKLVRVGDSYSAGEGISIENNVISVTGDYGHAYYPGENISISDDNVISSKDWSSDIDTAAQNVSAETTAWVSEQGYITDASLSDYALITDVETTSGLLKMDIDAVSASITGKMDTTAFNDWQNGQYSNDIGGLSNDIDTVSGAVDAISGAVSSLDIPTHQEIIDASGYAYSQSTAWVSSQGYLTQHQDISYLATKSEVDTVSSFLSGAIDYVSANAGDDFPASANDAITAYQTYSGTYLTSHQDISNLATKDEVSAYTLTTTLEQVSGDIVSQIPSIEGLATTGDLNSVSSFLSGAIDYVSANAGDDFPVSADEAIQYVQGNSATINDVNSTVQSNSAQWGQGTSVETIPVAVISPLVTGFSGESAYLGIESTALNLSSYVPVSAIGVNSQGYVSGISGKEISARVAVTAQHAFTANKAYYDGNSNTITSYYQPKLTISGDAGTITSINGSAVGASIPEGWELVAGAGIEIVDDAENNQTTISVTAQGGNPEVESYVQTNSASIDDVVSTYQTNSGSYLTSHQDISNKLDTTAFSDVSGSFLTAVNIPESATWNDASNVVQTNSASWNYTPTYDYTDTDLISAIDTSGLFAQGLLSGSHIGRNIVWDGGVGVSNASQMWLNPDQSHFSLTSGIFSPLSYATGATITYGSSGSPAPNDGQIFGGFFKGNEWFVSNATAGQALRGETHNSRGVHISGATTAGNSFDLSVNAVSGKNDTTNNYNWKLERGCVSGKGVNGEWRYGVEEDTALRTVSALEYNAVDEISGIAGSAIAQYGAEKQWLQHDDTIVHVANSAQYAFGCNISALQRLMGVDETVLWSGTRTSSIQTSESMKNFEKCQVYIAHGTYGPPQVYTIDFADMGTTGYFAITRPRGSSNLNIACIRLTADDTHLATVNAKCLAFGPWSTTATGVTATTGEAEDLNSIIKVVGIGRKA